MNCHRVQKRLAAYQDGEVGGKEREQITAHMEGCSACRAAYAELETAWQSLGVIPEIEASRGFDQRLFAKLRTAPESRSWWRTTWVWFPAPAAAFGLLLIGVALGGYLGNALVSGSRSVPDGTVISQNSVDVHSFNAFSAVPRGTLGDAYLRMAGFTEDR
jgi:anti-sigma factor RsiW